MPNANYVQARILHMLNFLHTVECRVVPKTILEV